MQFAISSQHYDELLRTEADLQNIENVVFKISRFGAAFLEEGLV